MYMCALYLEGLCTSAVMKWADNLVKVFARAGSMFLLAGISWLVLGNPVHPQLLIGGVLTALGVALYSIKPERVRSTCFGRRGKNPHGGGFIGGDSLGGFNGFGFNGERRTRGHADGGGGEGEDGGDGRSIPRRGRSLLIGGGSTSSTDLLSELRNASA